MSDTADRKWILLAAALALSSAGVTSAAELGDPTRPSHVKTERRAAEPRGPSWVVESIIVSPARKLATVNGRVVGVNDWVNGARVTEILPYEVRLDYKGESRRISLIPIRVKSPAN